MEVQAVASTRFCTLIRQALLLHRVDRMAARGQIFLAVAVLGGALLPFVRQAEAASDKYIVLLDIEGERSPRLKKSINRMIKEQYKVMEGSSYKDAARRLRAEKLTPTNVKKVCGYLEVDGVVDGTIVKEDGRYKFTLRLRSAVTGAISKKIPMFINQPSLSQNMSDQLEERLLAAIADLPRAGGGTKIKNKSKFAADEDEDEDVVPIKGKKGKKAKGADDEDDEDEEDEPKKMTKAEKRAAEKKAKAAALAEKKAEEKAAREEAAREKKEREQAEKEMAKKKKKARSDDDEDEDDEADEEVASKSKKGKKDSKKAAAAKEDDDEADDDEAAVDEDDAEDEDEPKRAAMRDAGDDDDDASNPDLGLEKSAARPSASTGMRTTPLLVNAGVSFVGRNLTFKSSAPADQQPQGYKGKTVPGVYATGELYPASFAGVKGVLANVGVGFVADRVIKLNSSVSDGMDGTALLAAKQSRYGANLRYRHNFGDGPRGVSVWGAVGYNRMTFSIDKAAAPENVIVDVPNVAYSYVDPGLGVRVPIAGALSAAVEGKFLAVLGTGEVQTPEQYGAATVTGFDADAALEYAFGDHFLARAGARLIQIGYSFKGNGTLSDRDANGSADVGGASDRYLGGYVTAGYAF
jgi:hypothetical protein